MLKKVKKISGGGKRKNTLRLKGSEACPPFELVNLELLSGNMLNTGLMQNRRLDLHVGT